MGFLQLPVGANLNKAVVSFWYRIPAATATIVRDAYQSFVFFDNPGLSGIVPLLTFGPQQSDTIYEFGSRHISQPGSSGDWGFCPNGFDGDVTAVVGNHTAMTPPSFIGVMYGGSPSDEGLLCVNLQTNQTPSVTSDYKSQAIGWNAPPGPVCEAGSFILEDIGYVECGKHISFNGSAAWAGIETDQWHHILISWDIGSGESSAFNNGDLVSEISSFISTDAKMWLAHDNINKAGNDLPVRWLYSQDSSSGGNPNSIVASRILEQAGLTGTGIMSCTMGTIPTGPISIPGPSVVLTEYGATTHPVQNVEMAELQIFAGLTLDTSNIENRRLFINDAGAPVHPSVAAEALGQAPDILLHGSNNWVSGNNTGSLGSFEPTGTINIVDRTPGVSL